MKRILSHCFTVLTGMLFLAACTSRPPTETQLIPAEASMQPFNSVWQYPTILNWRPGDGLKVNVNPPRFSWPYLPEIVAEDLRGIRPTVFSMEISADASFESPRVRVEDTPYNFYNALEPLPPGTWYWRVGYGSQPDPQWSEPRSFVVEAEIPAWDRSLIEEAAARLREREGPRMLPRARPGRSGTRGSRSIRTPARGTGC